MTYEQQKRWVSIAFVFLKKMIIVKIHIQYFLGKNTNSL